MHLHLAGFVESFNISVAAALIMYEAQQQRLRAGGCYGDLGPEQQRQLLAEFLLRGVVSGANRHFVGSRLPCAVEVVVFIAIHQM
jgi:hypothetical protein